ncbi:MAG: TRAP transporter permease [Alphaproteobacteria bacterium]
MSRQHFLWLWCGLVAAFHIYAALSGAVREPDLGALHFALFMVSLALLVEQKNTLTQWLDRLAAGLGVISALYIVFRLEGLYAAGVSLNFFDKSIAVTAILAVLWGAHRAAGPIIPLLSLAGLAYMAGATTNLAGPFQFPGLSLETLLFRSAYETTGLFGSIATLSAGTVFPFVLFGALLVRAGAAESAIVLASKATGKMTGGPALAAIFGSALTGTMTGSAVANTATTGAVTIPTMKRHGFSPSFSAGVEAAASTGGQIMPPVMGAGAFVMIALTGLDYGTIVAASIAPAILYFLSVAFAVRVEARKQGLTEKPEEESSKGALTIFRILSFAVPFTALATMLGIGYTPSFAALCSMGLVIVMSFFTDKKLTPSELAGAVEGAVRTMAPLAALLVCVGLITLSVTATGLGPTFSLMLTEWAGGNLYIMLGLIALASLILGLGLPVTAAYIVLATVAAPALTAIITDEVLMHTILAGAIVPDAKPLLALSGIQGNSIAELKDAFLVADPALMALIRETALNPAIIAGATLAAHLAIFWLSQDSNVTPPVALAAFTAAGIAKASPLKSGFVAWRLAKGLYFLPVLMLSGPLVRGDWVSASVAAIMAVPALYAITIAIAGHGQHRLPFMMRPLLGAIGVTLLFGLPFWVDALLAGVVVLHYCHERGAIRHVVARLKPA